MKSVETYFGEVEKVKLVEVKTKKGKTYKAHPLLSVAKNEETKKEQINNDDLPF